MIREVRGNHLFFDGCDTVELAGRYGTPLYVFSESDIVDKCAELRRDFLQKYENVRAAYACKAFCTLAMCKIVEREGLCLDVVSGGELYTAVKAGFPAGRIEFNGNNKQRAEIELAVEYGIGRIIIDGLQELALIEQICREKGKKMRVLYRITPEVENDTHSYISTGKKDSKFGIPLDEDVIYPAIRAAIGSEWVEFMGFHFHVGSQLFDNRSHLEAMKTSLELTRQTKERFGYEVRELNYGGGFGIRYLPGQERRPYRCFTDPMMEQTISYCREHGLTRPAVVIEPGRSLVGEAGLTLYTVGSIKEIPGVRKYVSVDGGMTDNIRVGLYQAEYEGMVASRAGEEPCQTVTISGKCCESTDILIRDARIPAVEPGDIFATFSTGAYGYAMASNYNKVNLPAAVLVREGRHALIVRRQSDAQLIQNELLPDFLTGD